MASLLTATSYLPIAAGVNYFTLKDDDVYYSCLGAKSFSLVDFVVARGRTYRNTFSAGDLGRAWVGAAGYPVNVPPIASDTVNSELFDDRLAQVDPRNTPFTITYMVMWDGATGAGNVIAYCEAALFEQFSIAAPVRY